MRTTLNLDDDVLLAVKEIASLSGRTAGQVLSELARAALSTSRAGGVERNGVPVLELTPDAGLVTPEIVESLRDDL